MKVQWICMWALALTSVATQSAGAVDIQPWWEQAVIRSASEILEDVDQLGLEKVLENADWDFQPAADSLAHSAQVPDRFDECSWYGAPGCIRPIPIQPIQNGYPADYSQMKKDALQSISVVVLRETLNFHKVKFEFNSIRDETGTLRWQFKVLDPVKGGQFQDLENEDVISAIMQFRKYLAGLLCNNPNVKRIDGLLNAFKLGERFRWDMSWALLGNDLPESPNKWMRFGPRWKRFVAAMEGIEAGVALKLRDPAGNQVSVNPAETVSSMGPVARKVGFIAREIAGMIRLIGDIIHQLLELFCKSDLSFNVKKENQKKDVVYKLLELRRQANETGGPLNQALQALGHEASRRTGRSLSFFP